LGWRGRISRRIPALTLESKQPGIRNNSAHQWTEKALGFMFIVAIIGVPIVLTYTITVYYIFRGKVVLTEESY
jgi:cytochrome bd-type quinol oxidase subunit 2